LNEGAADDDNWMTDRVRWGAVLCAVVLVVAAVGGVPTVAANTDESTARVDSDAEENEAPLADAGLDQEVPVNATVYLDASGARDPDGNIDSYEWSIERPDGTPTSPRCDTCARSEFRVEMVGTYNVTVTVTDDDGATSTDTLYVEVRDVEGPSVELSGPTSVTAGTNVTFEASATAGENPLASIDWARNGSEFADVAVSGEGATDEQVRRFEPGTYELSAEVVSKLGRTDTARLVVEVLPNASQRATQPCLRATWNATADAWDAGGCDPSQRSGGSDIGSVSGTACSRYDREDDFYCNNDRLMYGNEDNIVIHDADNDGEVTVMGETLDVEASNGEMGRSYRMTREEYKERFDTDTVRPLDSQKARSAFEAESDQETTFDGTGNDGGNSDENQTNSGNNNGCENVPRRYRTGC
jgi:hypothetical protein